MEKNRELFKKFTEAVDIGDEVQIKSILFSLAFSNNSKRATNN